MVSPVSGTTTSAYGEDRGTHAHAGVDIAAPTGTPVVAAQCGTVTQSGAQGAYGLLVCVDHGGGVSSCYAHLSETLVATGQEVHAGDTVGRVGTTGRSTGPHLHFEVRENGRAVDPDPYLEGDQTVTAHVAALPAEQRS